MFRQIEDYPDPVLTMIRHAAGRPVLRLLPGSIGEIEAADDVSPLFDRLRAEMGLPVGDDRCWTVSGRHVRLPEWLPRPTEVSDPTVELLERVLRGLARA